MSTAVRRTIVSASTILNIKSNLRSPLITTICPSHTLHMDPASFT
nr:MAG TPA: hypothetical protein [Caudoviricetes sp.]